MIRVTGVVILLYATLFIDRSPAQEFKCGQADTETLNPLSNLNTFPVFGGRHLPATGVVRAFVVFVQFKDHTTADQNWPVNSLPNWAASFVDSVADGNYPTGSLSQRYHQWSGGQYHLVGNYFSQLVVTSRNSSEYTSRGQINREVLDTVDRYVNFALYDSLSRPQPYVFNNSPDGIVDLIIILYRGAPQGVNYLDWGNSTLDTDGSAAWRDTTNEGKIIDGGFPGSGVTLVYGARPSSGLVTPFEDAVGIAVHEVGHKLFGAFHFTHNFAMLGSMSDEWGGSAFHSIERRWLGWGNDFIYANNSSNTITLRDFFTTGDAVTLKIGTANNEWLILENRQRIDQYDRARVPGLYMYHFGEAIDNRARGTVRILSADGMWDWTLKTSTNQLERGSSDPTNGRTKLEPTQINNIDYKPPGYQGDSLDAFNIGYKTLLSSTTNPGAYTRNGTAMLTRIELLSNSNGVLSVKVENLPPPAPILVEPSNGATNVSITPTFKWNRSLSGTSYQFQLSRVSDFSTLRNNETLSDTFFVGSGLNTLLNDTKYYWRVNASNQYGTSNWSQIDSFTTIPLPPSTPVLVSPANAATNVFLTSSLQWNSSTGAVSYTVHWSTDSTLLSGVDSVVTTSTSHPLSGFAYSTEYFWKVKASNAGGSSPFSDRWSFTTVPPPPPVPVMRTIRSVRATEMTPEWYDVAGETGYNVYMTTDTTMGFTKVKTEAVDRRTSRVQGDLAPDFRTPRKDIILYQEVSRCQKERDDDLMHSLNLMLCG